MRKHTVALLTLIFAAGIGTANAAENARYYLSLGDSLARGIQPINGVYTETNQGYADDLYAIARLGTPGLRLQKLGCSGETTRTMIEGGVCSYALGSQLAEAVTFLQTHRVAFVTLDIGADNVLTCFSLAGVDQSCLQERITEMLVDLTQILPALRQAAGPKVPIVAMNYYDPFLAAWVLGSYGEALAIQTLEATTLFNDTLENMYRTYGVKVADVESAFRTTDFRALPFVGTPVNVFIALTWTWMGASTADIHPNAVGYAAIAGAFAKALARQ